MNTDDHTLLGIKWREDSFIDTALPFGMRSVPEIFSAFADGLSRVFGPKVLRGSYTTLTSLGIRMARWGGVEVNFLLHLCVGTSYSVRYTE